MSGEENICSDEIIDMVNSAMDVLKPIWIEIYGTEANHSSRVTLLKKNIEACLDKLTSEYQEKKDSLIERIENSLKKKSEMEKLLKLDNIENSYNYNGPLVELDIFLLNLIDKYKMIEVSRMEKLNTLLQEEHELCKFLTKKVDKFIMENDKIPTEEELNTLQNKIKKLEDERVELINTFTQHKIELSNLLEELGEPPISAIEFFALDPANHEFPVSKANLEKLMKKCSQYSVMKENRVAEMSDLKKELTTIWPKIKRDPEDLKVILEENDGCTRSVIDKLRNLAKECKEIRRLNLKDIIMDTKLDLECLWDECFVGKTEREQFEAYQTKDFSEDILTLLEMEIERLKTYNDKYNQIFKLVNTRREMWERLDELEERAKDSTRLKNRGGQLLLEEKERKTLQKNLPKIEAKLIAKVDEYEQTEQKQFLYFGSDIRDVIRMQWERKNDEKENAKMARKMANIKTIEREAMLGAKPPLSAQKRKLAKSQSELSQVPKKVHKPGVSTSRQARHPGLVLRTPNQGMTLRTPNRYLTPSSSMNSLSSISSYNNFENNMTPNLRSTPAKKN